MFAAIRATYNIPRDENLKLRDFPTLAHVIRFVHDRRPDLASPGTALPSLSRPSPSQQDPVKEKVLEIVAEKTGYPKDMLDLDLDLEADLGVDTVKQAEMFASVRAAYNIPRDENLKLRDFPTLAHVIQFAHDRLPGTEGATTAAEEQRLCINDCAPARPSPPASTRRIAFRAACPCPLCVRRSPSANQRA